MKTLFFCNLRPDKTGAFERVLAALGHVHQLHNDRLVLVLAGEPIPEVADGFRNAGIEWHVIPGWAAGRKRPQTTDHSPETKGNVGGALRAATGQHRNQAGAIAAAERASHIKERDTTGTGENVHPWRFLWPSLRLLRQERPDVAVIHFGNELPSLALSLIAPLFGIRGLKWVWQQDQQIAASGRLTRWVSRIRLLAMRFNRFVVVYEGGRAAMTARGIPAARIAVVHNGVMDPEPGRNRDQVRREITSRQWAVGSGQWAVGHRPQTICATGASACGGDHRPETEGNVGGALRGHPELGRRAATGLDLNFECAIAARSAPPTLRNEDVALKSQLPLSHPLLLMSVGSMIPRKRQAVLVEIFAELVREMKLPAMQLILIGDGPERAALEQQVRALGLQNQVVFLGKRNDVARLLCGTDVFVHAAVAEGCAYALSEAMAAGVPLVVTAAGAAREQVAEGVNGFVVEPEDRAMFKERVRALIRDVQLRERMGGASRERWEKGFRVEDQARAYWEIYRGVAQAET